MSRALPFLEYSKQVRETSKDQFLYPLIGFYSQPMQAHLINALFEGWRTTDYAKDKSPCAWRCLWNDDIIEKYYDSYQLGKLDHGEGVIIDCYECFEPKTLNDFISDCNRAGIELIWEPEVIEKYFSGKAVSA